MLNRTLKVRSSQLCATHHDDVAPTVALGLKKSIRIADRFGYFCVLMT